MRSRGGVAPRAAGALTPEGLLRFSGVRVRRWPEVKVAGMFLTEGGTGDCNIGDGSGDAWPDCL